MKARRFSSKLVAVATVSAAAGLLAACGSSSSAAGNSSASGSSGVTTTVASSSGTVSTQPTSIGTIPVADRSPAGTSGQEPKVIVPSGNPPATLEVADLITGTGAEAKPGDTVTVQYIGYAYSSKAKFDASWDRGQPFVFPLGAGQVIRGWDIGVAGMKVGGRRELIIPSGLAYGTSAPPGSGIAENDTLVFIVDLVKVAPPSS